MAQAEDRRDDQPRTTRALSLRVSLVLIIVIVSSIGLFGSSIAVHYSMRSVLISQTDEELASALTGWTQNPELYSSGAVHTSPDFSVLVLTTTREIYMLHDEERSRPDFSQVQVNGPPRTIDSVPEAETNTQWRAVGSVNTGNMIFIVAKSLDPMKRVLAGLDAVLIFINLIALVLMAVIGAAFVQRALAPLREVKSTARAIAGGDLSRRVPSWSPNTEVGQLSLALNSMLGRLQESLETAQHSLTVAQSKEEQMRRFVGDASHELRTPLTSVRGYTELYRSGATDDVERVLDKIEEESGRMKLLVEDLLALTRAEGSRLNLRTVDLLELALSAASTARAAFPERSIEVVNDTSEVPVVNGDPDRLHQALLNLITNGLRHGGEGTAVTLRLHRDPADDGHVLIDVVDDGQGMSEDTAAHIFERFYRADSSRYRGSGGGSGLGLSIVRSIIDQHDGAIKVASKEGVGTTFRITLSQAVEEQPEPQEEEEAVPKPKPAKPKPKGKLFNGKAKNKEPKGSEDPPRDDG